MNKKRSLVLVIALLAALLVPASTSAQTGYSLVISGGDEQWALVQSDYAEPLRVTLTYNGQPVAGASVHFLAPSCWGEFQYIPPTIRNFDVTAYTDASGVASMYPRADIKEGSVEVSASAYGQTVIFHLHNTQTDSENSYISISAGERHSCAVISDGHVTCWGDNTYGQSSPPEGVLFKQVSVSLWHSCGITTDDTIRCWGTEDTGRISGAPTGTFTQISVAQWHGCGLRTDGTIDCWGKPDGGRTDDPPGTFIQVSSAAWNNCAITTEHHVYCWGHPRAAPPTYADGTPWPFIEVSVGPWHACGIWENRAGIECWGTNDYGRMDGPAPDGYSQHLFYNIAAGAFHTCVLGKHPQASVYTQRYAHCWGSNDSGRSDPPGDESTIPYSRIAAGRDHTCAITGSGGIVCWGYNGSGQAPAEIGGLQNGPGFTVSSTAPTNDHVCTNAHCTLPEAIEFANKSPCPSTIFLTAGAVYTLKNDIYEGSGLYINTPITIEGNGATIQRSTETGTANIRMALVDTGGKLTLKNVTVQGFQSSTLHGGAIYNNGTVTIVGSTLSQNSGVAGGAIYNNGTVTIVRSTLSQNSGVAGGAIFNNGTMTVANSTFYDNHATVQGGAITNGADRSLTVINSTFLANFSPDGAAIKIREWARVALFKNTLFVKGPTEYHNNCSGYMTIGIDNIMGDDYSCYTDFLKTAAEIRLQPLANNGGPTFTLALGSGSAAIDQGNTTACKDSLMAYGSGWIDQRGYGRFADGNGDGYKYCDIGAFEYNATSGGSAPAPDTTPPQARILLDPTDPGGANGWYIGPVTMKPEARDTESGVIELRCALDPQTPPTTYADLPEDICPFLAGAPVSEDGPHTLYMVAMDEAGNQSGVISKAFQIDATPPTLTCPAAGPFLLNSGEQAIGPAGVDASVSGLDEALSTLSGIVATESVGPKPLTFTAFDLAGNSASLECGYNVIYDFGGFYPPVEPAPALNPAQPGSAIPIKFSLAGDQGLEVLAEGFPTIQPVSCDTLQPIGDPSAAKPAGKSGLSYDPETGWYNYVWKTDKAWAGTCQALASQLVDGTQHVAYFQFP